MRNTARNKKPGIVLKRYYKDCISVKDPNYDVEAYVRKTGFWYTLGENSGNKNVLHISNIVSFLEQCERDHMKVEFIGFKEADYIRC